MKIIVGLGNIGEKYEKTRHNVGFMVIEKLAKELSANFKNKPKFIAEIAEAEYNNEKLILVKPTTYMNRSGDAVSRIANFYKTKPEDLILIYDDIDLPLGVIRIKQEGSAGTHNGMKSVIECMNSASIPRIKIGTESRGILIPKKETVDFVLSKFSSKEKPTIKKSIEKAAASVLTILKEGIEEAMRKFN